MVPPDESVVSTPDSPLAPDGDADPKKLEVLFVGADDGVARAMVSRKDVAFRWALTSTEANAAIKEGAFDLVIVPSRLAPQIIPASRGREIPSIVRLETGDVTSCAPWVAQGALVLPETDEFGMLSLVSHLLGLEFPESPRVPLQQIVDVEIGGEQHALEAVDVSGSGISILDFPSSAIGSVATIGIDRTTDSPLELNGTVVRIFRLDGRRAAGLVFRDLLPNERRALAAIVSMNLSRAPALPDGPAALATPTADLPVQPNAIRMASVTAHLEGRVEDSPWWLASVVEDLTPSERRSAAPATTGREENARWARYALEARLFVYGLRAQAGAKNLTQSHFRIARELCRDLAKHGEGEPSLSLYELTRARSAILRALYGTEQSVELEEAGPSTAATISFANDESREPSWERSQQEARTREEAQRLIARGDVARAARTFAFADMLDEAIHLYLNVLGSPGDAAPLATRRWGLEHGAELYELAGQTEDAAKTWAAVARMSETPDRFIGRVIGLDTAVAEALLVDLCRARPLNVDSVEIHYRYALCLVRNGKPVEALQVLEWIMQTIGTYKDVERRIVHLNRRVSADSATAPNEDLAKVPVVVGIAEAPPIPGPIELADIVAEAGASAQRSISAPEIDTDLIGDLLDGTEATGKKRPALVDDVLPALLVDEAVQATAKGPTFDDLVARLAGLDGRARVDAWYWLALIDIRRGAWVDAIRFLDRIEAESPGYRRARARADAVRLWQSSMRARCDHLDVEGAPSRGSHVRYVLRGELGRGPAAVVFRARDRKTGRDVALKMFTKAARESWGDDRMVLRRLTLAARIRHPNVATISDFGELEGRIYVVSEVVEDDRAQTAAAGESLVETLRRAESLSSAVAAAHAHDLIHGAIKPSNVRIGPMGIMKLVDFSPALPFTNGPSVLPMNALAFQSAGQIAGRTPTAAADIFSIGAWLYTAISNRPPFEGLDRDTPPPPIARHDWLNETLRRALHATPSARFYSVDEFRAVLADVLERTRNASEATTADIADGNFGEERVSIV